jgi:beta-glucosidase-like glycosyl hydrolase
MINHCLGFTVLVWFHRVHKQALALEAARDSIALVKNEDKALPLKLEAGQTVVLAGKGCNSLVRQAGGWTLHWCGLSFVLWLLCGFVRRER